MKASDYGMPAHKVAEAERLFAEQRGGGRQLAAQPNVMSSGKLPRKGTAPPPRPAAPPDQLSQGHHAVFKFDTPFGEVVKQKGPGWATVSGSPEGIAFTNTADRENPPTVKITLPEPPSANRYWRHVGARVLLSREARQYRKDVGARILTTFGTRGVQRFMKPGVRVAVTLKWYRGRKSGDLDNRIKQLLDSLRGIIFADDSQVIELHCFRYDDKDFPRVELTVSQAST